MILIEFCDNVFKHCAVPVLADVSRYMNFSYYNVIYLAISFYRVYIFGTGNKPKTHQTNSYSNSWVYLGVSGFKPLPQ